MVLLEFSMFPLDKGESLSQYVARSIDIIDRSGLAYQTHAMGTVLEGEIDQVLDVVRRCYEAMAADCNRIECSIKIDSRKGKFGPSAIQGRQRGGETRPADQEVTCPRAIIEPVKYRIGTTRSASSHDRSKTDPATCPTPN